MYGSNIFVRYILYYLNMTYSNYFVLYIVTLRHPFCFRFYILFYFSSYLFSCILIISLSPYHNHLRIKRTHVRYYILYDKDNEETLNKGQSIICIRYYCDSGIINLSSNVIFACKRQGQIGIWFSNGQLCNEKKQVKGKTTRPVKFPFSICNILQTGLCSIEKYFQPSYYTLGRFLLLGNKTMRVLVFVTIAILLCIWFDNNLRYSFNFL